MNHIEIKNLSYRFSKKQTILDNINLQVPAGAIYGFLGPNGAGKTTTLRLLLGLLKKQEGDIIVFGERFENNRIGILKQLGSLIESPSLYAHLTARENLLVWQKVYQCSVQRIDEVLQIVGLADVGRKKAGNFSLGMKQRLGLAIALLNKPSLLVLDEPTNGLDPNGIIEMRQLLLQLNQQFGITILISSHLLSEVEKLITHVGIINKGQLLFEGTLNSLKSRQQKVSTVFIKTNNNTNAAQVLNPHFSSKDIGEALEVTIAEKEEIASIIRLLVTNNISVYEVNTSSTDLESAFMNLIG